MMNKNIRTQYQSTLSNQMFSATVGSLVTSLCTTPLDVVKTRMQVQTGKCISMECVKCITCSGENHLIFRSTTDAFFKIIKLEGVKALWRGLYPTLLMQIPTNCLYFAGYERMKRVLHSKHLTGYYVPLIAGVTARTFAVLFTCPLELIRTATQASVEVKPTKVLSNAIKNGGFRSLWTGLWPTLMRDCPFSAIYWVSLESTRKYLQSSSNIPPYLINFISGATGGAIAATLTTPIDVIKTRMQAKIGNTQFDSPYNSTLQSIRRIMKQDGVLGFTKGMVPRVLKVVPSCAIMIATYEAAKEFLAEKTVIESSLIGRQINK